MIGEARDLRSNYPWGFYGVAPRVSFLWAGYQPLDFLSLQHPESLANYITCHAVDLEGIGVGWEHFLENTLSSGSGPAS